MSYSELSQKYSRDERYKSVEKSRERESYFSEYIAELKKKERDVRKQERDKVSVTKNMITYDNFCMNMKV